MTVQTTKTYNNIIDDIAIQIYNNIENNNADYHLIPNEFKNNEEFGPYNWVSNGDRYAGYWKVKVINNYISPTNYTSYTQVSDNIKNWLNDKGYDYTQQINDDNFVGFFNYMVDYVSKHLVYGVSDIYNKNNPSDVDKKILYFSINGVAGDYEERSAIITAKSVNDMLHILENIISLDLRIVPVKYEYTVV